MNKEQTKEEMLKKAKKYETTMKEAWENKFHNDLREAHMLGQAHLYERCNKCSFRQQQLNDFMGVE